MREALQNRRFMLFWIQVFDMGGRLEEFKVQGLKFKVWEPRWFPDIFGQLVPFPLPLS